jgi:hypothetical protein
MHWRFYLHLVLWSALVGIFIGLSIPAVAPAVRENKIGPIDPDHSTDSYLSGLSHIRDGSQLFANLIDTLPRDKSLVIFVNADSSPSEFLGMLVAYLSWPLEVRIVKVRPEALDQQLAAAKSPSVAGLFFCSVKPPSSLSGGTQFGSEILFVPAAGAGFKQ